MGQTGNGHPAQVLGEDDHHYNGPVRREKGISLVLCRLLKAVHKNNSVTGRVAGWLKKVRLETFFSIFAKNFFLFFFSKNGQYFHTNKKKRWKTKKIAAARPASILATR